MWYELSQWQLTQHSFSLILEVQRNTWTNAAIHRPNKTTQHKKQNKSTKMQSLITGIRGKYEKNRRCHWDPRGRVICFFWKMSLLSPRMSSWGRGNSSLTIVIITDHFWCTQGGRWTHIWTEIRWNTSSQKATGQCNSTWNYEPTSDRTMPTEIRGGRVHSLKHGGSDIRSVKDHHWNNSKSIQFRYDHRIPPDSAPLCCR